LKSFLNPQSAIRNQIFRNRKEGFMAARLKIKKNDQVIVLSGRDKGRRGRVIDVLTKKGKVIVEGVNMLKHHERPNRQRGIAGGILEREAPIDASNVMVIEGGKPTRVGFQILSDGRKVRVAKKSGAVIE
jgi:large subunit ribosomal protein L24